MAVAVVMIMAVTTIAVNCMFIFLSMLTGRAGKMFPRKSVGRPVHPLSHSQLLLQGLCNNTSAIIPVLLICSSVPFVRWTSIHSRWAWFLQIWNPLTLWQDSRQLPEVQGDLRQGCFYWTPTASVKVDPLIFHPMACDCQNESIKAGLQPTLFLLLCFKFLLCFLGLDMILPLWNLSQLVWSHIQGWRWGWSGTLSWFCRPVP